MKIFTSQMFLYFVVKKAFCKMLVKVTTGVNFINILQAAFAPIFFFQKIIKPICNYRKAVQSTFV